MIYNNNPLDTNSLKDALLTLGFDEESVNCAIEFLDTDKERDYTLLDRIKLRVFERDHYYPTLHTIVKNEIRKKHDTELLNRYALVSFALAGQKAHCLFDFNADLNLIESLFLPAFISRYGEEEAQIYLHAVVSTDWKGFEFKPEYCVKAAEYILGRGDELHALELCENIFDCSEKSDEDTKKKACEIVLKCCNETKKHTPVHVAALASYVNSSAEAKEHFKNTISPFRFIAVNGAHNSVVLHDVLEAIADIPSLIDVKYITNLSASCRNIYSSVYSKHLPRLAGEYTKLYDEAMKYIKDAETLRIFINGMKEGCPEHECDFSGLKEGLQKHIVVNLSKEFPNRTEITAYLFGAADFEEIYPAIENHNMGYTYGSSRSTYYTAFGLDEFVVRCLCIIYNSIDRWNNAVSAFTGFSFSKENIKEFTDKIVNEVKNPDAVVKILSNAVEATWNLSVYLLSTHIYKHAELISKADVSKLNVTGKILYLTAFEKEPDKYKENVLRFSSETGKAVKEALVEFLAKTNWTDDICELLKSKKAAIRETAVAVIEKQGAENYKDALINAFAVEKSEKIKVRIGALLGEKVETAKKSDVDELKKLTSGNKTKKLDWLFATPFSPVKTTEGEVAEDNLLKALMMCYAVEAGSVNPLAKGISEKLNVKDLEKFGCEVFGKWLENGAEAKTKWVLYFSSVYGGNEMIDNLMHYIKEWSEHSRGAIAAEAVYALALNGSSNALMKVDNMSRRFKKRQVKDAAGYALINAAEKLGITKEELADRIVPDMGFDERMCRTFDYGNRQFSVYLTPSLEIEIFNGDKKIKNLPKPGVNDDAEKSAKAYSDFKDMKKQMKTVVTTQRERLEYVLMCDRKWNCVDWRKLFVANPVMHCFAIGLIWGVYEDEKLITSFRYLDDGSFTTSEEDEFELPENASIGLVHPIELTEEEKTAWIQQLSDYEIVQPFNQLSRPVYKVEDDELEREDCLRFDGNDAVSHTFAGRMAKAGWEKGIAQDAGCFFEYYHYDISGITKNDEGIRIETGCIAELSFSGMYIGVFEVDAEDITIEKLKFRKPSGNKIQYMKCGEVNKRYFSEIILQLTGAAGSQETNE